MPPRELRTSNGRRLSGFFLFTKSDFPLTRKERRDGFWMKDGDSIYITCTACGSVLDVSGHGIHKYSGAQLQGYLLDKKVNYGHGASCAVCDECSSHMFFYLENYEYENREDDGENHEEYDDDYDDDDDE